MKWELVVTDTKVGKTGRVRIEAPDQATAERIAGEKGWVVESVRLFETPGIYPPGHPAAIRQTAAQPLSQRSTAASTESEEPGDAAGEFAGSGEASATEEAAADRAEHEEHNDQDDDPYAAAARSINPLSPGAGVIKAPLPVADEAVSPPASNRYVPPAPTLMPPKPTQPMITAAAIPVSAHTMTHGKPPAVCKLLCLIFWAVGLGLIGWGAMQLAYFAGYAPVDTFSDGTTSGIAANRLTEIKLLMRGLVGGVLIGAGLVAAVLGTLLGRSRKA